MQRDFCRDRKAHPRIASFEGRPGLKDSHGKHLLARGVSNCFSVWRRRIHGQRRRNLVLKELFSSLLLISSLVLPCAAQRKPVLPQIDLPHPYYFREMYLPQLTSGPSSLSWAPDSKELVYSMAGSLWRQKLDSREAVQLTSGGAVNVEPRWSPDGKKLVWVSTQYNKRFHVFVAEVKTGALENVMRLTGGNEEFPPPVLLQRVRHGD